MAVFGSSPVIRRGARDEGERPFWISFADMMTAMMVLFLLVVSVALLSVTKPKAARDDDIKKLCESVSTASKSYPGVSVDCEHHVIDFGERARFDVDRYDLKPEQERLLRGYVPEVLKIAGNPLGQKWLKRVTVEGYTDNTGTYLHNLNLSLQRSQEVLCALLADSRADDHPLSAQDGVEIERLFVVGGYSSNSTKASKEASRRIELRLEFYGVDEAKKRSAEIYQGETGKCALPT